MKTTVQIIRDDTHAIVFVRGEHGVNTISLMPRDIAPESKRIEKLIKRVEKRAKQKK